MAGDFQQDAGAQQKLGPPWAQGVSFDVHSMGLERLHEEGAFGGVSDSGLVLRKVCIARASPFTIGDMLHRVRVCGHVLASPLVVSGKICSIDGLNLC